VAGQYVVDVVPGALRVQVHAHSRYSGSLEVPCWTYVSVGLRQVSHREIALSIRRNPAARRDAYPYDPLHLVAGIREAARNGHRAEFGEYTELGPTGFLGDATVRGIGYVAPYRLDGSVVPADTLVAVPLVGGELATAQRYGLTRVTARLGQAYLYYPCPPWYDPGRPAHSPERERDRSILDGIAAVTVPASCALLRDGALLLRLPRRAADRLAGIPADGPAALFTQPDPDATACLVWRSGQGGPTAITPPGGDHTALTGGFVAFVAGQDADEVRVVEDGFAVMLRDESWAAVRSALTTGSAYTGSRCTVSFY